MNGCMNVGWKEGINERTSEWSIGEGVTRQRQTALSSSLTAVLWTKPPHGPLYMTTNPGHRSERPATNAV